MEFPMDILRIVNRKPVGEVEGNEEKGSENIAVTSGYRVPSLPRESRKGSLFLLSLRAFGAPSGRTGRDRPEKKERVHTS
jgi:hypothetical protein